MGPLLLKTFLGLGLTGAGLFLVYFYMKGLDSGVTPFLLLGALVLVGVGVFFLLQAGKSNASVMKEGVVENEKTTQHGQGGFEKVLERNNEITKKWEQTSQLKDKLNVMQSAAEAGTSES